MKVARNITELIGNTPLMYLNKVVDGSKATVLAKLESFNPCASGKDRIGVSLISDAEKEGKIQSGKNGPHRAYQWQYRHCPWHLWRQ